MHYDNDRMAVAGEIEVFGREAVSLVGRDSAVSIATRYGLDGPGIESW
jgi:hypothetical protein